MFARLLHVPLGCTSLTLLALWSRIDAFYDLKLKTKRGFFRNVAEEKFRAHELL